MIPFDWNTDAPAQCLFNRYPSPIKPDLDILVEFLYEKCASENSLMILLATTDGASQPETFAEDAIHRGSPSRPRRTRRNQVPYSEMAKRREAEKNGRIQKTCLRISDYLRQHEEDVAKKAVHDKGYSDVSFYDAKTSLDTLKRMRDEENHAAQEMQVHAAVVESPKPAEQNETPLAPEVPETPSRGWNMRSFMSAIPSSLNRILTSPFRRRSEPSRRSEPRRRSRSELFAPLFAGPSRDADGTSFADYVTHATKGEEQQTQGTSESGHDLSYSLFPSQFDMSQIGATNVESTIALPETLARGDHSESTPNHHTNKRKRDSPDTIPNPPGSSYGMDMRYFTYDSSDEEEGDRSEGDYTSTNRAEQIMSTVPSETQTVDRNILRKTKRVRFDDSPTDTPSKLRVKSRLHIDSTDHSRRGSLFNSSGKGFMSSQPRSEPIFSNFGSSSTLTSTDMARPREIPINEFPEDAEHVVATDTSEAQKSTAPKKLFVPNPYGTYCLDYSMFSDDSDEEEPNQPTAEPAGRQSAIERQNGESAEPSSQPPATPKLQTQLLPQSMLPQSSPGHIPGTMSAISKLRDQAEKYKPRNPSSLRMSTRYSSSPQFTGNDKSKASDQTPVGERQGEQTQATEERREQREQERQKVQQENQEKQKKLEKQKTLESHERQKIKLEIPDDLSQISWPSATRYGEIEFNENANQMVDEMWMREDSGTAISLFDTQLTQFASA